MKQPRRQTPWSKSLPAGSYYEFSVAASLHADGWSRQPPAADEPCGMALASQQPPTCHTVLCSQPPGEPPPALLLLAAPVVAQKMGLSTLLPAQETF